MPNIAKPPKSITLGFEKSRDLSSKELVDHIPDSIYLKNGMINELMDTLSGPEHEARTPTNKVR